MSGRHINILGIETSCDETAAAIVQNGRVILSNVIASSLKEHQKFGGIIPEIASRRQLECINSVVASALHKADLKLNDVHYVAVTSSPGLIGSLLVGLSYARALSFSIGKPLIEVNHVESHLYASFLEDPSQTPARLRPRLPAIGLIISGGHTSLYVIKDFKNLNLLGHTRDDAAGEAFDKVARILHLSYPGGPVIDRLAKQASRSQLTFPCSELGDSHDFSFSGLKTAVLYHTQKNPVTTDEERAEIARAFQESVVSILVKKSINACEKLKIPTLLIGGGVAANSALRETLLTKATAHSIKAFFPPFQLCVDNAAMIAGYAYHQRK